MAKQRFEKERQMRVFSRICAGGVRDSAAARPLLNAFLVSKPPASPSDTIQAQVERLTAEAKKLNGAGKEAQALDTYRKAAELMRERRGCSTALPSSRESSRSRA
jgi:hypothetical protein